MEPVGYLRCLQNLLLLFLQPVNRLGPLVTYGVFKTCCYFFLQAAIDETRWLLTASSNLLLLFLTSSESMGSVGYLRCLQNLLLLSYNQRIDGVRGLRCLQKMLQTPKFTLLYQFLKGTDKSTYSHSRISV